MWFTGCSLAQRIAAFDSPEEVARLLREGTDSQRAQLKDALHLPFIFGPDCACAVETVRATFEQGKQDAILKVKRSYDFDLIVLRRRQDGTWQYLDSMPLDAAYDLLTVDLQAIVSPPLEDIVVHDHVSARGTDIFQGDFLVLRVIDGRLRVVLDAVEESHVQLWNNPNPTVKQTSIFEISPKSGDTPAVIKEKQTLTLGEQTAMLEREFYWDNDLRAFEVGLWWAYKRIPKDRK
jgi:hypothetical protein